MNIMLQYPRRSRVLAVCLNGARHISRSFSWRWLDISYQNALFGVVVISSYLYDVNRTEWVFNSGSLSTQNISSHFTSLQRPKSEQSRLQKSQLRLPMHFPSHSLYNSLGFQQVGSNNAFRWCIVCSVGQFQLWMRCNKSFCKVCQVMSRFVPWFLWESPSPLQKNVL